MDNLQVNRRPLKARQTNWAKAIAALLTRLGVHPNQVSFASLGFAALAGFLLLLGFLSTLPLVIRAVMLVLAGASILLRGLCNMLDGMIAMEGGKRKASGEIYNELPDRFSDAIIFVCAGYALNWLSWGISLGWLVALLAVLTAYVRALGGAAGATQNFSGPMAKTRRIYLMSAACALSAVEIMLNQTQYLGLVMSVALTLIALGCLVTIGIRTKRIIRELEQQAK